MIICAQVIDASGVTFWTPLQIASINGHTDVVELLSSRQHNLKRWQ
jgi:hypothetical protein